MYLGPLCFRNDHDSPSLSMLPPTLLMAASRCTVTALHFSQIGKNRQNWQPRHSSARTCPGQHASGNSPSSRGMTSDTLAFFSQPTSFRADGFHLPHCATNQHYLEPSTSYLSPCSLLYVTFPLSCELTFVSMQYVYFIVTVVIP